MPEIKSWTVTYKNPVTGVEIQAAVCAPDKKSAMEAAKANNITVGPYGPPWKILNIQETVFPKGPGKSDAPPRPAPTEQSEQFEDINEALACQAEHPGAEIDYHHGYPIVLNGELTYDIPENRPHWTVTWPV